MGSGAIEGTNTGPSYRDPKLTVGFIRTPMLELGVDIRNQNRFHLMHARPHILGAHIH